MKQWKKILLIMMCTGMMSSLVTGCGSSDTSTDNGSVQDYRNNNNTTSPQPENQDTAGQDNTDNRNGATDGTDKGDGLVDDIGDDIKDGVDDLTDNNGTRNNTDNNNTTNNNR